jgi:hypothetical protein
MIVLLAWAIIRQSIDSISWGHDSFQITEWLINYSGGFVRRGLPGSIFHIVSQLTGIQANYLVIALSLICYVSLVTWFLLRASRSYPMILILSCILMGFPAYQDSIIRKDCLGLLLLLACLKVDHSQWRRSIAVPTINFLCIVAILSHESFVFYGLPALVLWSRRDFLGSSPLPLFKKALLLLPAGICFALVSLFHGTPEIATAVNHSWLPLWEALNPGNPKIYQPSASIQALGWDSQKGLSMALTMLTSGFYQPGAWLMIFVISFLLFIVYVGRDETQPMKSKARATSLLLVQLILISPLFILGIDYGRWLFLWMASTVMLDSHDRSAPMWLEKSIAKIFDQAKIESIISYLPAKDCYLLCFGVPVCWTAFNFITAGPICHSTYKIWEIWSK